MDNYYDEHITPIHRNEGSTSTLWRASDLQCSQECIPVTGLHQCSREHVLQSNSTLEQADGVLRPGQGYAYTFLNGIKLFCFDGQKANLIAQKYWGGCDYRIFNEYFAKEQSILMLKGFLEGQLKLQGAHVSDQELASFARGMVEETQRKQLA